MFVFYSILAKCFEAVSM